jgi:hypothetical protein
VWWRLLMQKAGRVRIYRERPAVRFFGVVYSTQPTRQVSQWAVCWHMDSGQGCVDTQGTGTGTQLASQGRRHSLSLSVCAYLYVYIAAHTCLALPGQGVWSSNANSGAS